MNRKVYVLTCEHWGGNSYLTEIIEVFVDEDLAKRKATSYQGKIPIHETHYSVIGVDFNKFGVVDDA